MSEHASEEFLQKIPRDELERWIRERIEALEEEIRYLRAILAQLGGVESEGGDPRRPRPGERVEEVRVGRRKIARVFKGEDYVRLAPLEPLAFPGEVRGYLEEVVAEIRAEQARLGREEGLARIDIKEATDGSVEEIVVSNLRNALEVIKAKAALKHAAEVAWQYTRAAMRGGDDGG